MERSWWEMRLEPLETRNMSIENNRRRVIVFRHCT